MLPSRWCGIWGMEVPSLSGGGRHYTVELNHNPNPHHCIGDVSLRLIKICWVKSHSGDQRMTKSPFMKTPKRPSYGPRPRVGPHHGKQDKIGPWPTLQQLSIYWRQKTTQSLLYEQVWVLTVIRTEFSLFAHTLMQRRIGPSSTWCASGILLTHSPSCECLS